jgi:predicted metal-binding transcription factor (methanogenesis marker protein 9)
MKNNVRDMLSKIVVSIKKDADDKVEAIRKESDNNSQSFELTIKVLDKYSGRTSFSEDELKEILSLICYENLGFCCGINKYCPSRDAVLEILGIDKGAYQEAKLAYGKTFINPKIKKN